MKKRGVGNWPYSSIKSAPDLMWTACVLFLMVSLRMRMLTVLSESEGLNPFNECTVFALKSRADLLDGVARSVRSKNVSYVEQMPFSSMLVFPRPPPPAMSACGSPRSLGSRYFVLIAFVYPPERT